mmetsp:Transcript_66995/g.155501  ORF Transcript_66995/g.155501 Transcript_66995/m.155501 type:complete len:276 (+) Transcript_66995:183-1010(+)
MTMSRCNGPAGSRPASPVEVEGAEPAKGLKLACRGVTWSTTLPLRSTTSNGPCVSGWMGTSRMHSQLWGTTRSAQKNASRFREDASLSSLALAGCVAGSALGLVGRSGADCDRELLLESSPPLRARRRPVPIKAAPAALPPEPRLKAPGRICAARLTTRPASSSSTRTSMTTPVPLRVRTSSAVCCCKAAACCCNSAPRCCRKGTACSSRKASSPSILPERVWMKTVFEFPCTAPGSRSLGLLEEFTSAAPSSSSGGTCATEACAFEGLTDAGVK